MGISMQQPIRSSLVVVRPLALALLLAGTLALGAARAEAGEALTAPARTTDQPLGTSTQSMIVESEGYACMGEDKSRKQTELASLQDAKRNASESAETHIRSETSLKDAMLEKDLVSAYASAQVRVLQELFKEWYQDAKLGDCYRVRLRAEVVPDGLALAALASKGESLEDNPTAPLRVRVWTDSPGYAAGESVRLYLKGNKPFYARVVYRQADGALVQLLPNPYRRSNHFEGGTVYELPSGEDRYAMEIGAPFGREQVTVYASTAPGGDPELEAAGKVYLVKTKAADLPAVTRGIRLTQMQGAKKASAAEFAEAATELETRASH
jgi:hypothetical protein